MGGSGQCSTAQTVRSSSPSSTDSLRSCAMQRTSPSMSTFLAKGRRCTAAPGSRASAGPASMSRNAGRCCGSTTEMPGFVGTRACARSVAPAARGRRTARGSRRSPACSDALPCMRAGFEIVESCAASSKREAALEHVDARIGMRELRRRRRAAAAARPATGAAAPETAAAPPAGAAPAPASRRVPACANTRAVNSGPYARFEDAALRGLHFGHLAGQHHQHQRARVIGGVDEIAQRLRDAGPQAFSA